MCAGSNRLSQSSLVGVGRSATLISEGAGAYWRAGAKETLRGRVEGRSMRLPLETDEWTIEVRRLRLPPSSKVSEAPSVREGEGPRFTSM